MRIILCVPHTRPDFTPGQQPSLCLHIIEKFCINLDTLPAFPKYTSLCRITQTYMLLLWRPKGSPLVCRSVMELILHLLQLTSGQMYPTLIQICSIQISQHNKHTKKTLRRLGTFSHPTETYHIFRFRSYKQNIKRIYQSIARKKIITEDMTRETVAAQSTRRTCSSVSLDSIDHNHTTCYVIADKIVSFTGAIEKEIFI